MVMAEKEGFEPSIPLWGIHDFQSCALDRATRLLHSGQTENYSIQLFYYSKCARQSQERLCRARRFFCGFVKYVRQRAALRRHLENRRLHGHAKFYH